MDKPKIKVNEETSRLNSTSLIFSMGAVEAIEED